jgi:hypothetical protein
MGLIAGSISLVVLKNGDDLKSLSTAIVQSMRLTQLRSIREDRPIQIRIDLEQNNIDFPEQSVTLPKRFSLTVKTAANQVIDEQQVGMTFYPDASSTGGFILLESDTEIFEISIIWMTGKIKTRYESKAT